MQKGYSYCVIHVHPPSYVVFVRHQLSHLFQDDSYFAEVSVFHNMIMSWVTLSNSLERQFYPNSAMPLLLESCSVSMDMIYVLSLLIIFLNFVWELIALLACPIFVDTTRFLLFVPARWYSGHWSELLGPALFGLVHEGLAPKN